MSYFLPETDPVLASCRGFALMHSQTIILEEDPLYLMGHHGIATRRVGLVSGGGSGHEPLHVGLIGIGGLDAWCPGQIFASPHSGQIYAASVSAAGLEGDVLHIVKDYTGDRLNFRIAADRLKSEGFKVAQVHVHEDLATAESGAGRRGTAATVIVEKLLGAAADQGMDLDELADLGREIVQRSRSIGVTARAHTSPETLQRAHRIPPGHIDYGVGIHGERGARTIARPPIETLVQRILADLLTDAPAAPDGWILLVNGLGATTRLELQAIAAIAADQMATREHAAAAVMADTLATALDTSGFSLTLTALSPGWLDLWNADLQSPLTSWPRSLRPPHRSESYPYPPRSLDAGPQGSRAVLDRYAAITRQVHDALGELDQAAGDGDFGVNLGRGVRLAVERVGQTREDGLRAAATVFREKIGDSAGPLLAILFDCLATATATDPSGRRPSVDLLAAASTRAVDAISQAGGASPGDRTLLDALDPAARALADAHEDQDDAVTTAALAAISGARSTATMLGTRGRASYLGDRALGTPDPGAIAVALLYVAMADAFEPRPAARLPAPGYVVQPPAAR
ncbi:dihydroxyacetone kinase subunit DhaK [Streptomyces sp. NPDC087850]|uniref:dihydroxyacetone kinase subunit DhaK n=1 Tax=Streptomyces sp. NPDC087850 TaxID=3365809 RepID=UPI00381A00F1